MSAYLIGVIVAVPILLMLLVVVDRYQAARGEPTLTVREWLLYGGIVIAAGVLVLIPGYLAGWRSTGFFPSLPLFGIAAYNIVTAARDEGSERRWRWIAAFALLAFALVVLTSA